MTTTSTVAEIKSISQLKFFKRHFILYKIGPTNQDLYFLFQKVNVSDLTTT